VDSKQFRRWFSRLPGLPKRAAGQRRSIELPRPSLGVLREIERPSVREMVASLSPRTRRSMAYAGGAGVIVTALLIAYNSAPLSVQAVDVRGTRTLSPDLIRRTAAVDDDSLTRPDLEGARERLLALSMVKDAKVERDWPFGVDITITERNVFGVWRAGGQQYVIDGEGVVVDAPPPNNGVVIVQTGAAGAFELGEQVGAGNVPVAVRLVMTSQQTLGRYVTKLQYSDTDGLTVWFSGDSEGERVRVLFGHPSDYDFKVAALYGILRRADDDGRSVRSVDLRYGQKVAVQWGEAA
jgi:cell division septal protein FtsQ